MPGINTTIQNEQWWLVQTTNGSIGLVQGPPPKTALSSILVGTAANFQDLMNNDAGAFGAAEGKLAGLKGVSQNQLAVLVQQLDAGAGAHYTTTNSGQYLGLTSLWVGSDASHNAVTSNEPTTLTGDVQQITGTPSVSSVLGAIGDIWSVLTAGATWLRVLEYVGGALLVYVAIKGLAG